MYKKVRMLIRLAVVALGAWGLAALWPAVCLAQGFVADITPQEFTVKPGDVVSGELRVSSTADKPVVLRVYLADSVRTPEALDGYAYSDALGQDARSLAAWTKFTPEQITLQPGESQQVSFEIRVPADAALKGSYFTTLFVSNAEAAEKVLAQAPAGGVGMGINMLFRFATFLAVTIEGTEAPEMSFTKIDVVQDGPWFNVTAALKNSGNTVAHPSSWLELRDESGKAVYTSERNPRFVLPESSRLIRFEVRQPVPAGAYLLMVVADYGAPKLIGAQGRMTIDEAGAKAMQAAYEALQAAQAAEPAAAGNAAPPIELPPGDAAPPSP